MDLKHLKKKAWPYVVFLSVIGALFLVLQMYLAIELQSNTVVCEGTFKYAKSVTTQTCPIGAYCKKINGEKFGICSPYIEYFDINKSERFNKIKELWR